MLLGFLREGAKSGLSKIVLSGIMVMAVGGLVLMDVGGFFRGGVQQNAVAKIAGQQLGAPAFDQTVRRVLARQNLDAQTAWKVGVIGQILQSQVAGTLIYRDARALGLRVGDQAVVRQISEIVKPFVTPEMPPKEALRRILFNQSLSEQQFVESLRTETASNILRAAMQTGVGYTPPAEIRDIYLYRNEQRTVKTIVLPNSDIKDYKEPTDEVLLPFYQAGQEQYAIPEARRFSVALLTHDDLKKTLEISDEELKKIYNDDIAAYSEPERRVIEQATLKDEAQARQVLAAVKDGASLRDAVRKVTGNAQSYGGDQTVDKDTMKAGANDVFNADKGKSVGPVKTAAGFQLFTVKDILPPRVQSFDSVRKSLHDETLHNRLADQLFAASGEIDDALAGGGTLEDIAKSYGLEVRSYGPVRADGSTPDSREGLKDFPDDRPALLQSVFGLNEGENAPVLELKNGSFAVIRLDTVAEKSYKPFDSVKKNLRDLWVSDQQDTLNKLRAQEALRALENSEKTLEQAAKDFGAKIQTVTVKRVGDTPAPLTATAKTKFFEAPRDGYAVATGENGFVIGQITAVKLPDSGKIPDEELKKVTALATQGTQDEIFLIYLNSLQDKYGVTINDRLLEKMYGPGSESTQ